MKPSIGYTVPVRKLVLELERIRRQLTALLCEDASMAGEIERLITEAEDLARMAAQHRLTREPEVFN